MIEKEKNVFIYCDPPYIDRNSDYYDNWNIDKERHLQQCLFESSNKFILSNHGTIMNTEKTNA